MNQWGVTVGLAVLMTGCATVDSVGVFSIDESELQQIAKQQLTGQGPSAGIEFGGSEIIKMNLVLDDLDLDLVSADGGAIVAGFDSTLNSTLPLIGTMKTRLTPKVQAGLELRDQAIYIVDPKILSLGIGDAVDQQLAGIMGGSNQALTDALARYFSNTPIYQLEDSPQARLAGRFLKSLTISDDRVSLRP